MTRKNPFAKWEKEEPFTKSEKAQYPLQKQHFIRGIQIRDNCKKDEAIKKADRYFLLPNKKRKEFSASVQKAIYDISGGKSKKRAPSGKLEPVRVKELPTKEELYGKKDREFSIKYTRKQVIQKLKNNEFSPSYTARIKSGMKNHPDDTYNQWSHGHTAGKKK